MPTCINMILQFFTIRKLSILYPDGLQDTKTSCRQSLLKAEEQPQEPREYSPDVKNIMYLLRGYDDGMMKFWNPVQQLTCLPVQINVGRLGRVVLSQYVMKINVVHIPRRNPDW